MGDPRTTRSRAAVSLFAGLFGAADDGRSESAIDPETASTPRDHD